MLFQKCKEGRKYTYEPFFNFSTADIFQQYSEPNHYGFSVCMRTVGMNACSYDDFVSKSTAQQMTHVFPVLI